MVDWKRLPRRTKLAAQLIRVGQIAVVADGQTAELEIRKKGLHIADQRAAGRRIAVVTDGGKTLELVDDRLGAETVADMAERAVGVKMLPVIGDDAARFLPAMLKGMQPQGRMGRRLAVAEDAEYAALFMQLVVVHPVVVLPESGRGRHRPARTYPADIKLLCAVDQPVKLLPRTEVIARLSAICTAIRCGHRN